MRGLVLVLALALLAAPARAESIVAGLSQAEIAITADFAGEEILVFGAIRREAPLPEGGAAQIIVTVEGPPAQVTVRRKSRNFGIWVNNEAVVIDRAPSFYAVAATSPLAEILSETDDLRHQITIPRAIRAVGITSEASDAPAFLDAMIRIRVADGDYARDEAGVDFAQQTLFRADFILPANLIEGEYRVRLFLTRDGRVVDALEEVIEVQKAGLERWIFNLSRQQPLVYGLLSLVLAALAGWGASEVFRRLRL